MYCTLQYTVQWTVCIFGDTVLHKIIVLYSTVPRDTVPRPPTAASQQIELCQQGAPQLQNTEQATKIP
jgi:hypothetical protein